MYHFVDLSDQEKLNRREQLDWYGWVAHISTLLPLLTVQIYMLISRYARSRRTTSKSVRRSAPTERSKWMTGPWDCLERFQMYALRALRIIEWYSDEDIWYAGIHLGTWGCLAFSALWTLWLVTLCVLETGQDFAHLTARLGLVGASQLPLVYLFSLRTPFSPLKGLTCNTLRPSMSLHKHLGAVVSLFFLLHSFMYLYMYICTSSVSAHLTKPFIIYGVAATLIVMLLCSTAVRAFRAWNYRVFYAIHVTAAAIVLPILCFHGRFMRIYLTEAILIYAASSILRTWVTQRVSGTLKTIQTPDSMILDIRIPEVECSQSWHPGQYALISREGNLISRLLGSVPLSIASLANDDKEMRLIARVRNGATRDLANLDRDASYRFNLEGPYGQSDHIAELLRCPKIVLVAGGVGGTFVVPIYRQLLQHMAARSRTHHNLAMHWIASSSADVAWALADRYLQEPGFKENLQIHLTQDRPDGHVSDKPENLPHIDDKSSSPFLEAVKTSPLRPTNVSPCCINLRYGRPDLGQLITSTFAEDVEARTAVVVCGPSSLITNVRRETGIWVCRGYACHWIAEDFES